MTGNAGPLLGDEDAARTTLQVHVRDEDGLCAGCQALWRRTVPHPCTQADWAQGVLGLRPANAAPVYLYPVVDHIWRDPV